MKTKKEEKKEKKNKRKKKRKKKKNKKREKRKEQGLSVLMFVVLHLSMLTWLVAISLTMLGPNIDI